MADKKNTTDRLGGIAGFGAGAITGAQFGTALIPIPVVGTFTGALIGGVLGTQVGKVLGGPIMDTISTLTGSGETKDRGAENSDMMSSLSA